MLFLNALPAFVALQALQFIPTALAEFRVTCSPFKRERIDPIATPGKENGHMHTFFGNRGIGPEMPSYEQLVNGCGSCGIAGDKSAYWVPTLYYVTKNATVPVKVAIFHIYYNGQNPNRESFPEDYNIISHDPTLSEEEVKAQGGNGMKWYFEDSDEQKENWQLPKQKGGGWLRGNVPFPTSVIKDESLGRYRACTANDTGCFNVLRMFFAIWYDLRHEFFDFQDGAYLTLSSGGGHTYHGDFIYGWERSFASMIVQDDTDYVNANGILPVGGEKSTIKSTECQRQDEEGFTLGKPDWDAMLEANAGNGTVELGHYGKSLTITNGKSMNATFSGKWGDAGKVDAEAFSEAPAASMNESKSGDQRTASIYSLPSVAASSASTSHTASVELPAATASAITTRKALPSACSRNKKIHGRRH
ncbi:hypothetical protein C7974DRAFT_417344 [Boeremia exigua]|uniref:uncharacterized protein n=1 Tax=Boeremia exigua TaxID=749465 RepID=UPI001E8CA528|nr:uncharacterized protein C7974DRAFT_417344 [Boeremia exigua]KAH6615154.1 hypothetical protein C7974DRAFT_417344 [Boeremia exigua]